MKNQSNNKRTGKGWHKQIPRHKAVALEAWKNKVAKNSTKLSHINPAKLIIGKQDNHMVDKSAKELYDLMFDKIGDNARFPSKTEYQIGVGRICEQNHCVFGSAMKSMWGNASEIAHIGEEISLMESDVKEYSRDHPHYNVLNDEDMINNANRVILISNTIKEKLAKIQPTTKRDRANIKIANMSNDIISKIATSIIENPSEKPFNVVAKNIKEIRHFFKYEYSPLFT